MENNINVLHVSGHTRFKCTRVLEFCWQDGFDRCVCFSSDSEKPTKKTKKINYGFIFGRGVLKRNVVSTFVKMKFCREQRKLTDAGLEPATCGLLYWVLQSSVQTSLQ